MAPEAAGRVALMSIHPRYAHAILAGRKTIEFRKRPLAGDVTHVVIYSTVPDRAVLGYFEIEGQRTDSPERLWNQFHDRGSINEDAFFSYYNGRDKATGIEVGKTFVLTPPMSLSRDLGVAHPPQSFQYLDAGAFTKVASAATPA